MPTSGNSFRMQLAQKLLPLAEQLARPLPMRPGLQKLLGVSATESRRPGHSADGVIVRTYHVEDWASALRQLAGK